MMAAARPPAVAADEQHRRDRARIAALERELDEAHETIRQLQFAAAATWSAPVEFALTGREEGVLRALLGANGVLTKDRIMHALYANRIDAEPQPKIVDVFVCKLRRKIAPFGVTIETVWGRGYSLPEASKAILRGEAAGAGGGA